VGGAQFGALLPACRAASVSPGRQVAVVCVPAGADHTATARALAAAVSSRRGVVGLVELEPGTHGRRALAALRRTVSRSAPCRGVWAVNGRVYPE
jgi:hypothetical protein